MLGGAVGFVHFKEFSGETPAFLPPGHAFDLEVPDLGGVEGLLEKGGGEGFVAYGEGA